MSKFYKSTVNILKEAAYSDGFDSSDDYSDLDIETELDDIDDMDVDLDYSEEMIPVIAQESTRGEMMYCVEFDILHKLMESKQINACEAVEVLAEYNGFPKGSSFVILDKISDMKGDIDRLNHKDQENVVKQIKQLKEAGIGVLAKKGKGKEKVCPGCGKKHSECTCDDK